jgi:very-short-patch-repair endonuclease
VIDKVERVLNISKMIGRRRELRNKLTPYEAKLWKLIRNNQMGVRFKRQYSIRNYVVDFYCHKAKLAIEIDGMIHVKTKIYDKYRTDYLKALGIHEIRFTNVQIENNVDEVINKIKTFFPLLK